MGDVLGTSRQATMNPDEPIVQLVGGPMPLALSCVSLRLRVAGHEVSAFMLPDRTVYLPEWTDPTASKAARKYISQFEKQHRIVVHELLKQARESLKTAAPESRGVVSATPKLNKARELVFCITLNEEELVLHVSSQLTPCQLHMTQDSRCDVAGLFAAYDLALEYMQSHIHEIEGVGFDVTVLRLSTRDWEGYRERLRLV
jgi:hypothetical protein